jgi:hypothetical protein
MLIVPKKIILLPKKHPLFDGVEVVGSCEITRYDPTNNIFYVTTKFFPLDCHTTSKVVGPSVVTRFATLSMCLVGAM